MTKARMKELLEWSSVVLDSDHSWHILYHAVI